jgi:hypothetical protein
LAPHTAIDKDRDLASGRLRASAERTVEGRVSAKAMRQRLIDSGALERSDSKIIVPPTVVEVAEAVTS